MRKEDREFEETGAFIDLMSKKERKRWKKEQARLKEYEFEIPKATETTINQSENTIEDNQAIQDLCNESDNSESQSEDINQENEIRQKDSVTEQDTQIDVTQSTTNNINELNTSAPKVEISLNEDPENIFEQEEVHSFNPVIPIGIVLMLIYIFFVLLIIFTNFDNDIFLIANATLIAILTIFFGFTALSNRNHVNVFAIFFLLLIMIIFLFNGVSILNYDNLYDERKQVEKASITDNIDEPKQPEPEVVPINEYNCTDSDENITVNIKEEKNYITYVERIEVVNSKDIADEIEKIYKDINGITVMKDNTKITLQFDFNVLDINQYKLALKAHNNLYRLETDFSYLEDENVNFEKYKDIELRNLTCTKKESN